MKEGAMGIHVPDGDGQTELKIHGGARKGAGRKRKGLENRKASISLPPDRWELIDKIQQLEEKTKSDVLAELIQIGLEQKLIELMEADGTIKWEESKMENVVSVVEVRKEFSRILLLKDMPQHEKDKHYARLMTTLESNFKIPMLRDEKFELLHPDVMRIYREISDARSL
jgi:hypothetical protein